VFDLMGADPDLDDARHILDWIARTGRPSFTRRDLFNELRSQRFAKVTALDPGLELLQEHGHIREQAAEKNPRGGRPSVGYDVHPAVHHLPAKPAEPAKP
jgi:replicative DNA helicase